MRTLTEREKRTIRLAGIGLAVYLVAFFGLSGWKRLEAKRSKYQQLELQAQRLQRELNAYENQALLAQKIKAALRLEPKNLNKATVVGEASAAIQKAAKTAGVQLGPMREMPARASAKELASMQIEGTGPVPSIVGLLYRLEILGYPLLIDSVQLNPDTRKPGQLQLSLTLIILDYEQWKEKPNA